MRIAATEDISRSVYTARTLRTLWRADFFGLKRPTRVVSAELNHVPPLEYLMSLPRHADAVRANPNEWMPWNYAATLARYTTGAGPPG